MQLHVTVLSIRKIAKGQWAGDEPGCDSWLVLRVGLSTTRSVKMGGGG